MKTDAGIRQDVIDELSWEPSVDATAIGVEVKDGIVTLAGHVGSYAEKWEAERAAQRVSGVKAMAVEMDVRLAGSSQRDDVDIARAAENVLQWTAFLPKDRVKLMVEGGWITLTGEVDWAYQRIAAETAVRCLFGVTGVSNQILVKPKASSSAIKADIEASLKRRAVADAQGIRVAVEGAEVTLSGAARHWSERDLARDSAWGTPGVQNVINNITVDY